MYSMCMPLFLPQVDLLPFYVFRGIHSAQDVHHISPHLDRNSSESPFMGPMNHNQWFSAGRRWSDRTDFARFPHLLRFGNAAELMAALTPGATDWAAVSLNMKRFNEE